MSKIPLNLWARNKALIPIPSRKLRAGENLKPPSLLAGSGLLTQTSPTLTTAAKAAKDKK